MMDLDQAHRISQILIDRGYHYVSAALTPESNLHEFAVSAVDPDGFIVRTDDPSWDGDDDTLERY